MNRKELLKWIKSRITTYYYEILELWAIEQERKSKKVKFYIESTTYGTGYKIYAKCFWFRDNMSVFK